MKTDTLSIMKYLAHGMAERGYQLMRTRLAKLFYLLEVEFYRKYRRRLTSLDWEFYKFGPYTFELENLLEKAGFEQEPIWEGEPESPRRLLPTEWDKKAEMDYEVRQLLDGLIRQWGDADLRDLLDYVYYETEPMLEASFREKLDFSTIGEWEPTILLDIPHQRLDALRSQLSAHLKETQIEEMAVPIAGAQEEPQSARPPKLPPIFTIRFYSNVLKKNAPR